MKSKNLTQTVLLISMAAFLSLLSTRVTAGSDTWLFAPGDGNWNLNTNWVGGSVPNGAADVATFDASGTTALSLSANTQVDSIVFNPAASAFTTTISPGLGLTISGTGIINNSGNTQNFVSSVDGGGSFGALLFTNSATAGTNTVFTNSGGTVAFSFTGYTEFFNTSSAGSGTFINNGGTGANTFGGFTDFFDTSDAGSATLIANGGSGGGGGGMILFIQNSTGGTSTVQVFGNGFLDISGHSIAGVTIGSIEGTGNVFLGANNLTVGSNNQSTTFSGVIQNGGIFGGASGDLTKIGIGTLTLSGTNIYTGDTYINGGILALESSGALGGGGNITFGGGTLQYSANNTTDYSARIVNSASAILIDTNGQSVTYTSILDSTNTGGVTKLGSGSLTLSGAYFYSGDTTVNGGVLQYGGYDVIPNGFGKGNVIVNALGTLDLNGFDGTINGLSGLGVVDNTSGTNSLLTAGGNDISSTFAGVIQNSSTGLLSLTKIGTGTLTLTGASAYSGDTSIDGGVLQYGANDVIPTGAGVDDVIVNALGTLDLNGFNGTINGLFGLGVVDNTLAASSSILSVGNNDATSAFDGVIQNTGGNNLFLTKIGNGTLTLTGVNTFTGDTVVTAGTLIVNGSITSNTTVNNGALLGGDGTIFGAVSNNGTVSPGNSPGTLTISGSYTQSSTGTLLTELATNVSYDNLTVVGVPGTATIDGTLHIVDSGYTPAIGDSLNILSSSGLSGTFSTVINPYAQNAGNLVYLSVLYTATDVFLVTTQNTFANALGALTLTPNQTATAEALDSSLSSPSQAAMLNYLDGFTIAAIPQQLDLIAPDELTSIFQMGFAGAHAQNLNIQRHLNLVRQGNGVNATRTESIKTPGDSKSGLAEETVTYYDNNLWNIWIEGTGTSASIDASSNANGYNFDTRGVTIGADRRLNDHFVVGVLGSYNALDANLTDGGSIDGENYRAAVYATFYKDGFFLDGLLGIGDNSYDTSRSSLGGFAEGNPDGWELNSLLNAGYNIHNGQWTITPMASASYTRVTLNSFTETGSLAPLSFPSQSQDSLLSDLGVKVAYSTKILGMEVTPQVRLAWQHEFLDSTQSMDSSFISVPGSMFTVDGPEIKRDRAMISAGLNVDVTQTVSIYAYYDGQLGSANSNSNSVTVGLNMSF